MTYQLNRDQMQDVAIGACILGAGGGGSYQAAKRLVDKAMPSDAVATVVEAGEVDDASWLCVSAHMGAPSALFRATNEFAAANAFDDFEKYLRQTDPGFPGTFGYVLPIELGAINSIAPLTVAVQRGIPVIDADGAGRSIPTLLLHTYAANGIPLFPNCIASNSTELGGSHHAASIHIGGDDPEGLAESAFLAVLRSAPFGGIAGIAAYAMDGTTLRRKPPPPGSLALALEIGQRYRRGGARERASEIARQVTRAGRACKEVFHGYVTGMAQSAGGTDVGHIVVSEHADGTGTQLWIYNENENIYACHSELSAPFIMSPDSICYVPAADDQEVLDNSDLWQIFQRPSYKPTEVCVLGVAAPAMVLQCAKLMRNWHAMRAEHGYAGPFLQRWLGF